MDAPVHGARAVKPWSARTRAATRQGRAWRPPRAPCLTGRTGPITARTTTIPIPASGNASAGNGRASEHAFARRSASTRTAHGRSSNNANPANLATTMARAPQPW